MGWWSFQIVTIGAWSPGRVAHPLTPEAVTDGTFPVPDNVVSCLGLLAQLPLHLFGFPAQDLDLETVKPVCTSIVVLPNPGEGLIPGSLILAETPSLRKPLRRSPLP